MARPTKEEKARKEALKATGIFERNNPIYTEFEKGVKALNRLDKIYVFCTECERRYMFHDETKNDYNDMASLDFTGINDPYKELFGIDEKIGAYMISQAAYTPLKGFYEKFPKLFPTIYNLIPTNLVIKALGGINNFNMFTNEVKKEIRDYLFHGDFIRYEEVMVWLILNGHEEQFKILQKKLSDYLTNNFKGEPLFGDFAYLTIVSKKMRYINPIAEVGTRNFKTFYIEIDPTKPLSDIIEEVTEIKKAYDKNPENFKSLSEHLNPTIKSEKCDLENCDILRKGSGGTAKPLEGIMSDMLFIYDCLFAGLDKKYIMKKINEYWQEIVCLSEDEMWEPTYKRYKKEIIEFIDKEKYKTLLTGYKFTF